MLNLNLTAKDAIEVLDATARELGIVSRFPKTAADYVAARPQAVTPRGN